jgi:uncharacterized protein with PQ loop repeat
MLGSPSHPQIISVLGFVGTIIAAVGYLPQIVHLAHEHCSAGVSIKAWCLWILSSLLIGTHAFVVFDLVFIALEVVNLAAMAMSSCWPGVIKECSAGSTGAMRSGSWAIVGANLAGGKAPIVYCCA